MNENNVLIMTFVLNTSEKYKINLPRARANVTDAQVRHAMETLIANGRIMSGKGRPISVEGAELVTTMIDSII